MDIKERVTANFKDRSLDNIKDGDESSFDVYLLMLKLRAEVFTLKDVKGLVPRVYNHWKNSSVLPVVRKNKLERISYIELFWLRIVITLREFGLPISKIIKVKQFLFAYDFENHENFNPKYYQEYYDKNGYIETDNYLGTIIAMLLEKKINSKLIVYTDGSCYFDNGRDDDYMINNYSHIAIPLLNIIKDFVKDAKSLNQLKNSGVLKEAEVEILNMIRDGSLKEVRIKTNEGEISHVETIKIVKASDEHRLLNVFTGNKYESLNIKKENGKIAYCEIITKYKVK